MAAGPRFRVRVSPGARETRIVGRQGDVWKVRVAAEPERGRANEELLRHLGERLTVRRGALAVVAGAGSRDKVVSVDGIDAADIEGRLSGAAGPAA